jgi:hypothetical protein
MGPIGIKLTRAPSLPLVGLQNKNANPIARESGKGLALIRMARHSMAARAGVKRLCHRAAQIPQTDKNFQAFLAPARYVQDTKTRFSDTPSPNRPCSRHWGVRLIDFVPRWLEPIGHQPLKGTTKE